MHIGQSQTKIKRFQYQGKIYSIVQKYRHLSLVCTKLENANYFVGLITIILVNSLNRKLEQKLTPSVLQPLITPHPLAPRRPHYPTKSTH